MTRLGLTGSPEHFYSLKALICEVLITSAQCNHSLTVQSRTDCTVCFFIFSLLFHNGMLMIRSASELTCLRASSAGTAGTEAIQGEGTSIPCAKKNLDLNMDLQNYTVLMHGCLITFLHKEQITRFLHESVSPKITAVKATGGILKTAPVHTGDRQCQQCYVDCLHPSRTLR